MAANGGELPKRAPGRRGAKSDNSYMGDSFFKHLETDMQNREIGEGPEQMLCIVHKLMYNEYYVRLCVMTCELGGQLASFGLAHPSLS